MLHEREDFRVSNRELQFLPLNMRQNKSQAIFAIFQCQKLFRVRVVAVNHLHLHRVPDFQIDIFLRIQHFNTAEIQTI
jgi:hypothetical protein